MRARICHRAAWCALLGLVTLPRPGFAGGLDQDDAGPRAIGRAGAAMVSEDGGAALSSNPGGLVRRRALRMQLGVRVDDTDLTYHAAGPPGSPAIKDLARPSLAPQLALVGPVGPLVAGAAYIELGAMNRRLPSPRMDQPGDDVALFYPHRYAGMELDYRRRTWLVGAALRVRPWLGAGVSMSFSRVDLAEKRHVWAGAPGRDDPDDAERDLALVISGHDSFVPGVSAGVLVAPPQLPVEMALSMSLTMDADLRGTASLMKTSAAASPAPAMDNPQSRANQVIPLMIRAGVRYLGERLLIEAGGALALYRDVPLVWNLDGVGVRDESLAPADITRVASLVKERNHASVRVSADIEVVAGFLWLTTGYACHTGASPEHSLTPGFADLDAHTIAFGAEGQWQGITFTIGYARTLNASANMTESQVMRIKPFDAAQTPAGTGTYYTARDVVAASVEMAWE